MPMNLQYEGDEGSNVWFPMTEGENWLQPRGRRVERVTYGGEPREVRHTHVDVNREIVPVNLAEHSGSLYDDLHHVSEVCMKPPVNDITFISLKDMNWLSYVLKSRKERCSSSSAS